MRMTQEQLEFAISQYLDGALMPLEKAALEERLASDAEARALLEEYRNLDAAMKAPVAELDGVRWDTVAQRILSAVAKEEIPSRSYVLPRILKVGSIAVAACIAIATTVWLASPGPTPPGGFAIVPPPPAPTPITIVDGPRIETASAAA